MSQTQTHQGAIWSLVLGILSFLCLSIFGAIPAVILGHISMSAIRKSEGELQGEGMALAGLIMGYINIALSLFVIPLLAAMLLPALNAGREKANEIKCKNNMQQIMIQAIVELDKNDNTPPASLDQLKGLPEELFVCPKAPDGETVSYLYIPLKHSSASQVTDEVGLSCKHHGELKGYWDGRVVKEPSPAPAF